jgi:hypothetical protein
MKLTPCDNAFSIYIRVRDADSNGMCKCISSGKLFHWTQCDAGHFINRKHLSLRFNECNVNAQSRSDNRWDEGNLEGYRRGLIEKYGPDIIDKLYAMKNQVKKFSDFEIKAMTKHFKSEADKIKKEKGL